MITVFQTAQMTSFIWYVMWLSAYTVILLLKSEGQRHCHLLSIFVIIRNVIFVSIASLHRRYLRM